MNINIHYDAMPDIGLAKVLITLYFPFLIGPWKDSEILLQLNSWFKHFVKENEVELLTLTETEPTKINKFYSTVIVPECDGGNWK